MTLEEAKQEILKYEDSYFAHNRIFKIRILPDDRDDMVNLVREFRTLNFTEADLIMYTISKKFRIYGIWIDGASVVTERIPTKGATEAIEEWNLNL